MILIPFYLIALVQLFFSWKSLSGGFRYLRFFREEIADGPKGSGLFASVIVPCKGTDKGLEENLAALLKQDHPAYEIVFVVDSEADPAVAAIEKVMGQARETGTTLVVAGKATGSGQKVHNLIAAASRIRPDSEVLVFVDSDARPSPDWLSRLTGAAEAGPGAASGYRWFIPHRGGLAGELRSAWNASIASVLGPDERSNFAWGGSTAILRPLFEELRVAERWQGKLADDFALTRMVNERGSGIRFVPSCLTASVEDCTFAELLEFTTRQMKITRVYRPDLWAYSLVGSALYLITVLLALTVVSAAAGVHALLAAAFLVFVAASGTAKAWLRLKAVRLALPEHADAIKRQAFWQLTLWAATPALYLYNDLAALASRRIVWRGVEYELESAEMTRIVNRDG